jgi:hypothetical protein
MRGERLGECGREARGLSGGNQPPRHGAHRFSHAADIERHDRNAASLRLAGDTRQALGARRQADNIELRVKPVEVVAVTEEVDAPDDRKLPGECVQRLRPISVADDHRVNVCRHQRQSCDQLILSFHMREAADAADQRRVWGQVERRPQPILGKRQEALQIDPVWNDVAGAAENGRGPESSS